MHALNHCYIIVSKTKMTVLMKVYNNNKMNEMKLENTFLKTVILVFLVLLYC